MPFVFDVKVVPGSGRSCWMLDKSGALKCYLKNQAEQGKANAELIKSIAKLLHIPQNMVSIVAGSQSRNKKIKIEIDISYNRLLELFGIQQQMNLFKS
jgi:uncharacterized protein YggU (UPF0235/DUF167 family)